MKREREAQAQADLKKEQDLRTAEEEAKRRGLRGAQSLLSGNYTGYNTNLGGT